MKYLISRSHRKLKGKINLTASKSESNRALIIQALASGVVNISNLAAAKDTETLVNILSEDSDIVDVGPAGTAMRFLTAYLAQKPGVRILTGSDRMKQRPIGFLVEALRQLGANISYVEEEGFPPIKIEGVSLKGRSVTIDGGVSSQYISALLLIGPNLPNGLNLTLSETVTSIPYIQMTINLMEHFGANVKWTKNQIEVAPGGYRADEFSVEADWSAASYWYQMAAYADEVDFKIAGLKEQSLQGDQVVREIFEQFGINSTFESDGVRLTKNGTSVCKHFNYDFSACPDIAQTLAVTCAGLGITSEMFGLHTLRIKETDRSLALKQELDKIGARVILESDDKLAISSFSECSDTPVFDTYEDHRMAMSFAPLAMHRAVIINDPEVVEKSYPAFWNDLRQLGFSVEIVI